MADFPATYDLTVKVGTDLNKTFTWYLDLARTQPVDLSGYQGAILDARTARDADATVIMHLEVGLGITLDAAGHVAIFVGGGTTHDYPPGTYPYDLNLIDGAGLIIPFLTGDFTVEPSAVV